MSGKGKGSRQLGYSYDDDYAPPEGCFVTGCRVFAGSEGCESDDEEQEEDDYVPPKSSKSSGGSKGGKGKKSESEKSSGKGKGMGSSYRYPIVAPGH